MMRSSASLIAIAFAVVLAWNALADHQPNVAVSLVGPSSALRSCRVHGRGVFVLPDTRCTPGEVNPNATQADIRRTICKRGWSRTGRPPESVTEPEKRRLVGAYGYYAGRRLQAYELDHLIPLELGGARDSPKNLWPEINYPGVSPDSFYLNPKDHLEDTLRTRVCRDEMTLRGAQYAIRSDWVAAYARYMQ